MSFRLSIQVFIHSCVGPHTWIDNCVLRATLLEQFKGDVSLNGCSFVFSTNKCAYQFPWTDIEGLCLTLERFLDVSSMNSCFKVAGLWKKHTIEVVCTEIDRRWAASLRTQSHSILSLYLACPLTNLSPIQCTGLKQADKRKASYVQDLAGLCKQSGFVLRKKTVK